MGVRIERGLESQGVISSIRVYQLVVLRADFPKGIITGYNCPCSLNLVHRSFELRHMDGTLVS